MREHSALDRLVAPGGIRPLYQPIYMLGEPAMPPVLFGFECLSRGPAGTNFEKAPVLFDYVRLKRQEALVDRICVATALGELPLLDPVTRVCLNVHASALARDHGFVDFLSHALDDSRLYPGRVIIDVVHPDAMYDGDGFRAAVARLRDLGVAIAIDDIGSGAANFKMLLDVAPEYMKLDRGIVSGCHSDPRRRAMVESLVALAAKLDSAVIAEGIECDDDLMMIELLGVDIVQGFLLAEPMSGRETPQHFISSIAV